MSIKQRKKLLHTCGYAAAENTNFVKRCSRVDLCQTANMNNSVFAKCRGSNKVMDWFSIYRESWLAIIDHNATVSVDSEKITHVALFRSTMATIPTFTSEHRKNMVSWFKISHTLPYTLHNSDNKQTKKDNIRSITNNLKHTNSNCKHDIERESYSLPSSFVSKYARKQRCLALKYTKKAIFEIHYHKM